MTIYLRQSTASQEVPLGYFLDSADGDTAEDALTIANTDIQVWKTGATSLANKNSGGATHMAGGVYYATLDATDTNTIGPLVLFVHVSGALACKVDCVVLDEAVYDVLFGTTAPSTYAGGDTSGTTTLLSRVVGTIASGTHNAQSGDSYARLGAPAGASVSADVAAVKAQTAAIETDTQDLQTQVGTDGAGLTNMPWNAAWDAEVQSEAQDAITASALATAANLATLAGYVDTEVAAILAAVDTEVAAIKAKTDYLPSATAGAAGGVFIAGANAATSVTTALTANITGNVSGSVGSVTGAVGSVTGAVGSVTGNVGGNVVGSVGSVSGDTKQTADVAALITTVGVAGAGLTALATQASVNTIDDFLDTEIAAILADTNELQTDLVNGGRLDLLIDAIKAKTDVIPASPAAVGSEMLLTAAYDAAKTAATQASVDDLPTNAELATALGTADDATLAAIAALNNLSSAQAQAAATAALTAYDPPTNAEMEARTLVAAGYATAAALDAVDNYVDSEIAAIKGVTDKLDTALELDGAVYRYTVNALELAPTGGSAPSAADIRSEMDANSTKLAAILEDTGTTLDALIKDVPTVAEFEARTLVAADYVIVSDLPAAAPSAATVADAVWDEALSGHLTSGTTGARLNTAASASGSGSTAYSNTVTDSASAPLDGAEVWITSDSGGAATVASTTTDTLGAFTVWLDPGTYYLWLAKGGYNFGNPTTITVS